MAVHRSTSLLRFVSNAACRFEPMFLKSYSQKIMKPTDGPVDSEVKFHGNLAQVWWDMETIEALHNLNEVRVPFIREGIHQLIPPNTGCHSLKTELVGVNILDVGCGGGILSEALARLKAHVTGLDPSPDLINIARKHAELDPRLENFLRYENESIHNYCLKNKNQFDAIAVSEVIEHISNKEKFVEDCLTCLKPGGSIFFTAPNKTLAAKVLIISIAERFGIIPKGTHDYDKFISAEDLSKLLKAYGCSIKRVEGILFNVMTKKSRFSASKCLMYALHAQKAGG